MPRQGALRPAHRHRDGRARGEDDERERGVDQRRAVDGTRAYGADAAFRDERDRDHAGGEYPSRATRRRGSAVNTAATSAHASRRRTRRRDDRLDRRPDHPERQDDVPHVVVRAERAPEEERHRVDEQRRGEARERPATAEPRRTPG
jgi:hypothetical protein